MRVTLLDHFNARYLAEPTSGCWLWEGRYHKDGYGQIKWGGKNILAHRASWMLNRGDIPVGLHVLHRCDNPACVNPNHLFLGNHADNMADMARKGRADRTHKNYGEKQWKSYLTGDQVDEMRRLGTSMSRRQLADLFGTSYSNVVQILIGKNWKSRLQASCDAALTIEMVTK